VISVRLMWGEVAYLTRNPVSWPGTMVHLITTLNRRHKHVSKSREEVEIIVLSLVSADLSFFTLKDFERPFNPTTQTGNPLSYAR
jgi:hypothetical protein